MKKQLYLLFSLIAFLLSSTLSHGQTAYFGKALSSVKPEGSGAPKAGKKSDDDGDGDGLTISDPYGNQIRVSTACNSSVIDVKIINNFDPNQPLELPITVQVIVNYKLLNQPLLGIQHRKINFSEFEYDDINLQDGIATKYIESFLHCPEYKGSAHINYSDYELIVIKTFRSGEKSISGTKVMVNNELVNRPFKPIILEEVSGFPNPFLDELKVSYNFLGLAQHISLSLIDMKGNVVWKNDQVQVDNPTNTFSINTTSLLDGTYILNISLSEGNIQKKRTLTVIKDSGTIK